jgi:hypothetical protein
VENRRHETVDDTVCREKFKIRDETGDLLEIGLLCDFRCCSLVLFVRRPLGALDLLHPCF